MPANILNLPSYRVVRVDESEHDYHIRATPVVPQAACPHCASDQGAVGPFLVHID